MRRSLGVNDHSFSGTIDTQQMDQNTVLALTHDVRAFSDSLTKLHNVIYKRNELGESLRVTAHERLGEVLCILKTILKKYPPVNSTDLLTSTGILISRIKGCNYNDAEQEFMELKEAIDQLALSFSSSVSEYLMGDMETSFVTTPLSSMQQSLDSSTSGTDVRQMETPKELLSAAKMDAHLLQMDSGVELALDRAKAWSKYAKDVITYIEKRTQLEAEFARGLSKLAHATRPVVMENSFLPFQSIFGTALDQDKDFANTAQAACNLIQNQKFIEPLSQRRAEHEKARKMLRDDWTKEVKRMNDAITNLKKAKLLYDQRSMEYEKAKDTATRLESDALGNSSGLSALKQLDKKKKMTEEMLTRATEAETTYKSCVFEANFRQSELEKSKGIILSQVRELITLCERTMKAATIAYFQLQHTVSAPAPVQYQTLCENCRLYEPGMQYSEFVRRLPPDDSLQHEPFTFEPYITSKLDDKSRKSSSLALLDSPSSSKMKSSTEKVGSESESLSSGNKSGDNSPTQSPNSSKRLTAINAYQSAAVDDIETHAGHSFKKLRTPSRCRVCDSYVYFNSMECEQCGTACHKKCLGNLTQQCGVSQTHRRMTTFGVSFDDHIQSMNVDVPIIVTQCIAEIDKRGLDIKGLYRVSGVKSKVEKLCQSFECGGEVDLSEHHPNVISNVLKLYLRQLPEPLMTVALYTEFVEIAREQSSGKLAGDELVLRLKRVVEKLPPANFKTAATIIHHLKRVSDLESENQMSPSNLGIVFGPTLLRPSEGPVNLDALMDTSHQTRAIELLIVNSQALFGPDLVKLLREASIAGDVSDNDSISSRDSSHRPHSANANLEDEIMTALTKPLDSSTKDSDEHLESITELSSHRESNKRLSDATKVGSYQTQVVRSASMPYHKLPGINPVEKSFSTEFKTMPSQSRQPPILLSANLQYTNLNAGNLDTNLPTKKSLSHKNALFYTPDSISKVTTSANKHDHGQVHVLPDIGAPDITAELIHNDRRLSLTSSNLGPNLNDVDSRVSHTSDVPSQKPLGKSVFHTHSMKKKSTEPKFV